MAIRVRKRLSKSRLKIPVLKHEVLGVNVLRGFARLCDLARMSRADIFDQKTNPSGTQRDLSPKHARDAYIYVKTEELAYWPEIFLCARNSEVISFTSLKERPEVGTLLVDIETVRSTHDVLISRVDGNHRLNFAGGDFEGYEAVTRVVSFCMAYDLPLDEEIKLFRDINNNQRRMSTSHLDNITVRLSQESILKRKEPDLYIAKTLAEDQSSPLHGMVYQGGKQVAGTPIPLRSLRSGISYMMSRPTKLTALNDPDAQYKVVKNYFEAVRRWVPEAWTNTKDYLVLRGAGLWGICFIGAEVIDRALAEGKFRPEDMIKILRSGRTWDWSNGGDFRGYSGRGGAVAIRDMVVAEFQDEKGLSVKELFKKIMDE